MGTGRRGGPGLVWVTPPGVGSSNLPLILPLIYTQYAPLDTAEGWLTAAAPRGSSPTGGTGA